MKNRAKRVKRLMKVWAVELRLQELKDELALLRLSCDFVVVRNGKAFNPKTKKLKEDIAILEEDPPEYDTFDGKYHGAESQKGKED